jgi:hypothetical protein
VEDISTVGGDAEVMKGAALRIATSEPLPVRDPVRSIYVTGSIHLYDDENSWGAWLNSVGAVSADG